MLKTKLEAIDTECEAEARPEIDQLYGDAKYNGSRFCVPSFQAAGAVWLRLIAEKEQRFVVEIGRILQIPGTVLGPLDRAEIQNLIDAKLSDGQLE